MYKFRMFEDQGVYISMIHKRSAEVDDAWTFVVVCGVRRHEGGDYNTFEDAEKAALKQAIECL